MFGLPVWYGLGSIALGVERAAVLGFDYVEISLDYPWPKAIEKEDLVMAVRIAKAKGIRLAFHAPFAGINLAHPREGIRTAAVKVIKSCIDFAKATASKAQQKPLYINVHFSLEAPVTCEFENVIEDVLAAAAKSRDELVAYGRRKNVAVTIENTPELLFGMPAQVKLLARKGARLCFDIGHAALINYELAEMGLPAPSLSDWITAFKDKILVAHIHDFNKTQGLNHLLPGKGGLKLRQELKRLQNTTRMKYVVLEAFWKSHLEAASSADLEKSLKLIKTWLSGKGVAKKSKSKAKSKSKRKKSKRS